MKERRKETGGGGKEDKGRKISRESGSVKSIYLKRIRGREV